jgi:hypothetical protein
MGKREENTKAYIDSIISKKFTTTEGYVVEIIGRPSPRNVEVKFEDGHTVIVRLQAIEKGSIKNVFHKSVFNTGFIGLGEYVSKIKGKHTATYIKWRGAIERCYSPNYYIKRPSYKGCSVAEEWHNFQVFAKWFEKNYNPKVMEGWHLDKDILVKGNKVYSPETCCFVPSEVNALLIKNKGIRGDLPIGIERKKSGKFLALCSKGKLNERIGLFNTPEEAFNAYKIAKEAYIKEVADKWKDQIDPKVYQALINYKVEITD